MESLCARSLVMLHQSSLQTGSTGSPTNSSQPLLPRVSPQSWRPGKWMRKHKISGAGALSAQMQASDGGGPRRMEFTYNSKRVIDEFAKQHDPENQQQRVNLTLFSPSKINVFLRITSKRPDGYHDLASLFHAISLGDVLKFSESPSNSRDSLTTNAPGVPLDSSNLIIKALDLFRRKTGINKYFWVHLDKRVPTGAGLGGGSGNAATALWAANQFAGEVASVAELQEWSGEIGSDIPFFFSTGAAYCTGRGEVVRDLGTPLPLDLPMVLIKPPDHCGTADVYKKFRLDNASQEDPEALLERICSQGISQGVCVNDLEAPAFEVLPSLNSLKQRVMAASRGRYKAVLMSGSGSTIVGIGDTEAPPFVYEKGFADHFVAAAQFVVRQENDWYRPLHPEAFSMSQATTDRDTILDQYKQVFK